MTSFNSMTIVAACKVLCNFNSHGDLKSLELEWNIGGRCDDNSKTNRCSDLAQIALEENPEVLTIDGRMSLSRAIVEKSISAPPINRKGGDWDKLVAGLRFDGFEIDEIKFESDNPWETDEKVEGYRLRRMYPDDVPNLDFKESESEVMHLLKKFQFNLPATHLDKAISQYSGGHWSEANGEIRKFFECLLDEVAEKLGCETSKTSKEKRDFLAKKDINFLYSSLNEAQHEKCKTPFIQGLISRLHPEGGHAGLSSDDDATFRLHIVLIASRLLLRRFPNIIGAPNA